MISGVYLLRFSDDSIYIGQSKDINRRYATHCNKLKTNKHTNIKMVAAYNNYGLPLLEIILECKEHELDVNETEAIAVYDSINNGLNIAPAAGDFPVLLGERNAHSKYSDADIILLAEYIFDNIDVPLKKISVDLDIHYSTVKNVANGTSHKWLAQAIPDKYSYIISYKGKRAINTSANKGIKYSIVSPTGVLHSISNISEFARNNYLNSGALGEVLRGTMSQHKGWTRYVQLNK